MSIRPWMPLYIADYRADTAHLGAAEHGAYLLLIMHYWQTGRLPTEDAPLSRIACMTPAEWKRARATVAAFFDDGWKHGRIEDEIQRAIEVAASNSAKATGAANKRWGKHRPKQSPKDARSINQALPQNAHSLSPSQKEEEAKQTFEQTNSHCAVAPATRTANERWFEDFWKVFPRRKGGSPKHAAEQKFKRIVNGDEKTAATLILAAGQFCKEMRDLGKFNTEMVPQAVKWLEEKRWLDSAGETSQSTSVGFVIRPNTHSEQWEAWRQHRIAAGQTTSFMDSVGQSEFDKFAVPSEWPPGYVPKAEAA